MGLLRGFSVGAVMKRMCKAVLKKGLGDFFLGELDLDQLDLQLTRGTLELTDLALNAEFINAQVRPDSPLSLSLPRGFT
jgi:autophagy-related protein 2